MKQVTIYTDGACKGNPGPGGWGTILSTTVKGKIHQKELFGGASNTTNNRMELQAVIEGLLALKITCEVDLYLDSQYVRKGITEWMADWKARNWKTSSKKPVKNTDLWQQLDSVVNENPLAHVIHWHWVKGHNGNLGNERADELANLGAAPYIKQI